MIRLFLVEYFEFFFKFHKRKSSFLHNKLSFCITFSQSPTQNWNTFLVFYVDIQEANFSICNLVIDLVPEFLVSTEEAVKLWWKNGEKPCASLP